MEEKKEVMAYLGEPWITYAFYDEKGRRLSIFAKQKDKELEITIITCSKKDQFSKKEAKSLYAQVNWGKTTCKPQRFTIPIKDDKPKWTFINWCRENYYHKEKATFMFDAYVLTKGDEILTGIEPCGSLEFVDLEEGKTPKIKKDGV